LTFAKLCEGRNDKIISLFEEEKTPDQAFQSVDENTVVVFCKRSDPAYEDTSYHGYYLAKKTMSCQDLLDRLAAMAGLKDGDKYKSYLEKGCLLIRDISLEDRSLDQSGIQSGSCIILRTLATDEGASLPDDVHQVNSAPDSLGESSSSSAINFVFNNPLFSSDTLERAQLVFVLFVICFTYGLFKI